MKIGVVISMYDEISIVKETISCLRNNNCKIVVIQSDPGNKEMVLNESLCDKYEKLSDIAGGRDEYAKVVEEKKYGKFELIGPIAITRNYNRGFSLIQDFDVDYVIGINGDLKITSLKGILKIIKKMIQDNKIVACTRNIGYNMYDEFGKHTQFQHRQITNIMPQFFIVDIKAVKKGLFCNTQRTNKYNTEQCFGDEIVRYCQEKNLRFFDIFYRICDYGYPRFVDGVHYNPEQISKIPAPFEKIINWFRYWSNECVNNFITKIYLKVENKFKN